MFIYYIVDSVTGDGMYPFAGRIKHSHNEPDYPLYRSECCFMIPPRGYNDPAYQDD
jgi:hypothetical protein